MNRNAFKASSLDCWPTIRAWIASLIAFACASCIVAQPNFDLVGFATLNASGQNGTYGGALGPHVQVSTLPDLVRYLETNAPYRVEIMNDIDLSSLTNANGGFPASYPTTHATKIPKCVLTRPPALLFSPAFI